MAQFNEKTKDRIAAICGLLDELFAHKFLNKLSKTTRALIFTAICLLLLWLGTFMVLEIIEAVIRMGVSFYLTFSETILGIVNRFIAARGKRALFVYAAVLVTAAYVAAQLLQRWIDYLTSRAKQSLFYEGVYDIPCERHIKKEEEKNNE